MELVLEQVAKKVEWAAFNATYADGTSGNRQMRGLKAHQDLSGGNSVNNDDGAGTPAAQKINWDIIASAMKTLYDAGAPMRQPVLFVSPTMLLDLNKELIKATVGSVNYGILPRDRNIGGVDIDTVVTPFGSIGLALSDVLPAGTIAGSKQAFIVDLSFVKPVFLNIPGYGTMYVRDLDQNDQARIAKAVYMEMAFDFGPQQYHCAIDNVVG